MNDEELLEQVMKQALEALEWVENCPRDYERVPAAITTLRATIKQMEKAEPAGYLCKVGLSVFQHKLLDHNNPADWEPLYAHPAQPSKVTCSLTMQR